LIKIFVYIFLNYFDLLISIIKKYKIIILKYFKIKNILKNNNYHTFKYTPTNNYRWFSAWLGTSELVVLYHVESAVPDPWIVAPSSKNRWTQAGNFTSIS